MDEDDAIDAGFVNFIPSLVQKASLKQVLKPKTRKKGDERAEKRSGNGERTQRRSPVLDSVPPSPSNQFLLIRMLAEN
jgi:hypothetical protein